MKRCSKCGETKGLEEFSRDSRRKDGRQRTCKGCYKAYRESRRDELNELNRKRRSENLDEYRAREAAQRRKHAASRSAYASAWQKANPEKVRSYRDRSVRNKQLIAVLMENL